MNVLQISADRSKRGILYPNSPAFKRQKAYAQRFGRLDIIAFSLKSDGAKVIEDSNLHIYPTNSSSRFLYGIDAKRVARKLPRPDVISVQDPFETGLVGWWIARKFGAPLHVQVHTDFLSPEYARLSMLNRVRVFVAGFVLKRAQRVRVVSERIKKSIEERYHIDKPISVLPIFVDVEKFRNAGPQPFPYLKDRIKLLVVARLEPEKNVQLAVRAFAEAAPENACLIITGEGTMKEVIMQERARHPSVFERVFFSEGETNLPAQYKAADLVLVPSLYEGYGLVIIEALAAGKPVLSTDVGIAREAGAIVTTPEKFAEALAQWFKDGPREGQLKNYPYANFDEYVQKYCDDIYVCSS